MIITDNGTNGKVIRPPTTADANFAIHVDPVITNLGGTVGPIETIGGVQARHVTDTQTTITGKILASGVSLETRFNLQRCTSLTPQYATVDNDGNISYVGDGTANFLATVYGITKRCSLKVSQTGGQEYYRGISFVDSNSFGASVSAAIDSKIVGYANQAAANASKLVFSVQNHAAGQYVRNPSCWAKDFDLTCASPWNSTGVNCRAGTLVSPRHVIFANHYPISDGATMRFVSRNNTVITATLITSQQIVLDGPTPTDIQVGILQADVPNSISYAKVLPANWKEIGVYPHFINRQYSLAYYNVVCPRYMPLLGFPLLVLDQEEKALVVDYNITSNYPAYANYVEYQTISGGVPTDPQRLLFYEDAIPGDSGDPVFAIINGEAVLLWTQKWPFAGSSSDLSFYTDEINATMTALSNANNYAGGGTDSYQLTPVDLSGFPVYEDILEE